MTDKNSKLWGGRFSGETSPVTERISSSVQFDSRLYKQDIKGSIAHARMLAECNIISIDEKDKIIKGLTEIENEIDEGSFEFSTKLEDIHMNIESRLTERIGDAGRRLHTARSRNDQIALDSRLYLKDEILSAKELLLSLIRLISDIAEREIDTVMPGYTHMQVAQPVRFSHHIMAYAWMFTRDLDRLNLSEKSSDVLPLGVGALAGVNYKTDREFLRKELGFAEISRNSMDTVSDRDFMLDYMSFASILAMHLSRLCEELVFWSAPEFNFIQMSDSVTTGSSIMPQKRNPDVAELVRGKTGRVYGNLFSLLTLMKGLPLAYNRDLQEDKEPLFDTCDTVRLSLEGVIEMLSSMKVNRENMRKAVYRNYSTATDIADYLVIKGMPFRNAHEVSGRIVRHCEENSIDFFRLTSAELREFSDLFDDDSGDILDPAGSTERKLSAGSTSKAGVLKQVDDIRKILTSKRYSK